MDWDRAETASGNRSVMPPGWIPVPWTVAPPGAAGGLDEALVAALGEEPVERCHHVLARGQQPGHHGRVGHDRRVDHAVGIQGHQLVDVIGGQHPERVEPAQLAHVAAGLVGAVDPAPDQLEFGMGDHRRRPPPAPPHRLPTG